LKTIVLIFILLALKLSCQVAPPGLRCLEVLPNGDVKLTWIPPADPSNAFDSYEIFSSISLSGGYTMVGTVGALAFTTYTHVGASATVQSKYYFVRTKFGPGGSTTSAHSDTLRSIHLNAVQATPDVKLTYNNLHLPALNTSSPTFTINKEYPMGTWSTLGVTAKLTYGDTISVCSASLNYRVALADNSGCVSLSNISGNIFNDAKTPDEPVFDSISVLPNGQTVLAWHIPRDLDITKYQIYYKIPPNINTAIDTVNGRNSTIYTYTPTTATLQAVALFVAAIDSCKKIGSFDIKPTTMFLKVNYNMCDYSTNLEWNAYQAMPKGISEYRIYYSVNGSAFNAVGSTTNTSFIHSNVSPSQNIAYFIRVFNADKSISSSSNRSGFFSTEAQAPAFVYVKTASVLNKNSAEIKIYIDISKNSEGIDLTRSEDGINFTGIVFLPPNGTADYSYTDESVDTKNISYYYRAIVRDSCGNLRTKSNISKTILLKVKEDKENSFNKHLTWTDYKGFAGNVSGYNIYRMINDVSPVSPVASTGPLDTTYIDNVEDEAPNGSNIKYYVEAIEGISNPYGLLEKSLSNVESVYMEDKIFVPTAFAPKGVNTIWLPITHFVDKTEYKVSVFNRWGAKIFEANDDKQGWDGKDAPSGIYVYLISYKNSLGEYKEVKGTFMML